MVLLLIDILCALASVLLYVCAPAGYDYGFCLSVMMLFLFQNGCWLVQGGRKRRLRFELLFMISFFFANLVYPVFYAPICYNWSFFIYKFNHYIVNQATALAYMAYAFYMLGIADRPWQNRPEPTSPTFVIRPLQLLILSSIALFCFGIFIVSGGYRALSSVYSGGGSLKDVGIFSYFLNIFTLAALLMAAFVFRIKGVWRWIILGVLGLFVAILLTTGSRQFSLSVMLVLIVCFSLYVYRLKGWQVIALMMGGALVLYALMMVRQLGLDFDAWQDKLSSAKHVGYFDMFEDLIINNLNLYILTDWGNNHACTWLHGFLIDLASPIPKLGSWLVDYYDEPMEMMHGGELPSYILLGHMRRWGIGTNLVGEAYRSFGTAGMCVFMFGLGSLLRESYFRANSSPYWYAFYMLMVGHAIIYPRAPLLYDPRIVVWSLLLLWLIIRSTERYYRVFRKEVTV